MAEITKPIYGEIWASNGERLAPELSKITGGWIQEMMPFQYENWIQNRQDVAVSYLLQAGVPEWDVDSENIANKTVVQYQGNLYMATVTNTGTLPTVQASWSRLTPATNQAGVVSLASGGTGATTAPAARTALGLGSIATQNSNAVNIDGGAIDGTAIGAATPSTGRFTTVVATGSVTAASFVGAITGNATSADKLSTARNIGGVAFDGTADIDLPGVTLPGNQNTTGNAGSATRLATARTINGVAFNGTGNITVADATKLPLAGGTITGSILSNVSGSWIAAATTAIIQNTATSEQASANFVPVLSANSEGGRMVLGTYGDALQANFYNAARLAAGTNGTDASANLLTESGGAVWTGNVTAASFTGALTGNATSATRLATARLIGGVSFNGTANINLPGVNATGNQDTTGNAATATTLATARTIALSGGATGTATSFNGGANITIPVTALDANQLTAGVVPIARLGNAVTKTSTTGSAGIPAGTTAQRDASPVAGYTRFNSTTGFLEYYNGTTWIVPNGTDLGGLIGTGSNQVSTNTMNDTKYVSLTNTVIDSINDGQIGGKRNVLINGAMFLAHEGTGEKPTTVPGQMGADCWAGVANPGTGQAFTINCYNPSTLPVPSLRFASRLKVNTFGTTLSSSYGCIQQAIEGTNMLRLIGKTFTLSFWVRGIRNGTSNVAFRSGKATKGYTLTYPVTTSWQRVSLTVPGGIPTSWTTADADYDGGAGMQVVWTALAGSEFRIGSTGSWINGNVLAPTGANYFTTSGDWLELAGCQLEVGTKATEFELQNYQEAIRDVNRYVYYADNVPIMAVIGSGAWGGGVTRIPFPVRMRVPPTVKSAVRVSASAGDVWCNVVEPTFGDAKLVFSSDMTSRPDHAAYSVLFTAYI